MAQVDPAVAGQHGHSATFKAACVLVHGFALSPEEAWPFALDYNSHAAVERARLEKKAQ